MGSDCHLHQGVAGSTKPNFLTGQTVGLQTRWTQTVAAQEAMASSNQCHRYLPWRTLKLAALRNGCKTLQPVQKAIRVPGKYRWNTGPTIGVSACRPHFHRSTICMRK